MLNRMECERSGKQGHPISHKFQSLSRDQAAFDAHPANFYYHTMQLYQTTACIFSNEIYIKNVDLLPFDC